MSNVPDYEIMVHGKLDPDDVHMIIKHICKSKYDINDFLDTTHAVLSKLYKGQCQEYTWTKYKFIIHLLHSLEETRGKHL